MTETLNVQDAKTRLSEPAPRREFGFAPGPPLPESFWEPMREEELAECGA